MASSSPVVAGLSVLALGTLAYLMYAASSSAEQQRVFWGGDEAAWRRQKQKKRRKNPIAPGKTWRSYVTHGDYVYAGAIPQMPDVVDRALSAGAVAPLEYVGTGMTAVVLCDQRGHAFKVARATKPIDRHMLAEEADWLQTAAQTPGVREHVAGFIRFHPDLIVIERACPMPIESDWRQRDEAKLWDLHFKVMGPHMLARGWTMPEFKPDSYVITERGPILVDASMPQRIGKRLLKYTLELLRGQHVDETHEYSRPSDYAFFIRREVGEKTISEHAAAPVLRALDELEANGNQWLRANPSRKLALKHIERTLPGIDDGMAHSFPVDEPMGDRIIRSPEYRQRRPFATLVRVRLDSLHATQRDVTRADVAMHIQQPQIVPTGLTFRGVLTDKPVVARYKGKLYIIDGHHRLTGLKLKGKTYARVRFVDLDTP